MSTVDPWGLDNRFLNRNLGNDDLWVPNSNSDAYYSHTWRPFKPPQYNSQLITFGGSLSHAHASIYLSSPKLGAFIFDPGGNALTNKVDQYGHSGPYYIRLGNTNNTHHIRTRDTIEIPHISLYDKYIDYHMVEMNKDNDAVLKELSLKLKHNEIDHIIALITGEGSYSNGYAPLKCASTLRQLLRNETTTYKNLSRWNNLLIFDTPDSLYDDVKEINEKQ